MEIGRILLLALMLIVGLYVLVNKLAVYALGTLTLDRNRELTILLAVVIGLGSAWAAHEADISPALGAFMAGMFLGSSQFATQIRADVSSLRVVLLTLFFSSAGMVANPEWILEHWYLVLGVTALVIAGKMAVVAAIFRGVGQMSTIAVATGLCLAQIGEFAFALGMIGQQNGVLSSDTYRLIVSVAIVMFLISPYLVPNAQRLAAWLARRSQRDGPADETGERLGRVAPHVAIIGFGPAGQVAAQPFVGLTTHVLVIDLNQENVQKAAQWGFDGFVGDATQSEVLRHARLYSAKAIVITIPHYSSAVTVLGQVLQFAPHAHTVVRSRYQLHSDDFLSAGADVVIGDEEEMGKALGRHIEEWLAAVERSDTHSPMVQVKAVGADVSLNS
jgi:CPA2 family monovalent cation:H+ antiporter-2